MKGTQTGTHGSLVTTARHHDAGSSATGRDTPDSQQAGKAMTSDDDFTRLDDPALLAERGRVRDELQALTERYRKLDDEFIRRARTAWAQAR